MWIDLNLVTKKMNKKQNKKTIQITHNLKIERLTEEERNNINSRRGLWNKEKILQYATEIKKQKSGKINAISFYNDIYLGNKDVNRDMNHRFYYCKRHLEDALRTLGLKDFIVATKNIKTENPEIRVVLK